jgi:hypothetical protein
MRTRLLTAVLGLSVVSLFGVPAQASFDRGLIASLYDQDGRGVHQARSKPRSARKARKGRRAGRSSRRQRYARGSGRRAVRVARRGGGASRSCLKPSARALLNRIESRFGPVRVVSTCRPGAVIAGSGKPSKHRYGLAVDFDAGSRKGAIVNWLRANHKSGGTMTYAHMSHVHVDIGQRFVSLGSGRRGGRRSRR